jgi:mono/diheme cytochrome c family protein
MTLGAINTQQKLGGLIVALLILGWIAYIVAQLRRPDAPPPGSEIELAPNRKPYLTDDELEGPKLDRSLSWALVLLVIVALGLPLYWSREPGRQANAKKGFDERAAHRGFLLFQPADSPIPAGNVGHFGCAGCHGSVGQGGAASFSISDPLHPDRPARQVQWAAPPLNTVVLRYTDDQIRNVLVYGRQGTPMPAWGVAGGGPMNDQQITDLVQYLHKLALTSKEAQAESVKANGETDGKALFNAYCSRCHTKGWSYGEPEVTGGGAFGPNLTNGATVRQFPDIKSHIDFITEGAVVDAAPLDQPAKPYGKAYGVRGVMGYDGGGMPAFGKILTDAQIRAIVEYERTL